MLSALAGSVSYRPGVRIAHITDCFAPRSGGIETQVLGLASRQAAAGHDVRVITATPGRGEHRNAPEEINDVPVVRITARLPFDLPVHPAVRSHVLHILRSDRIDVVHAHVGVASPFAWGGVRAARQARCATVVTVHSMWDPVTRSGLRLLDRTAWGLGSGVVLSAVGAKAALRVQSALDVPVRVLPNGIDAEAWQVDHIDAGDDVLRLVSVLRLAPRKRALPLMHVIRQAFEMTGGRIRATVIGDGPDTGRVERFIDRYGLQGVITLTGRLTASRIRAHFAVSDVFVQASVRESFGIAALEARTAGLPVIARRETGTSDFVIDGLEGILTDDDPGLVQAIAQLQSDSAWRREIGEHNRAIPPKQDWTNVLPAVEDAYESARAQRIGKGRRALG